MTENNKKQALVFEGAKVLPNRTEWHPEWLLKKKDTLHTSYQVHP